ncbi:MAG: arsenic efflux protein, partial [Firmicutes bacterium]|nr:arsenic efflux protein [Bacillota bacterium]
MKELFLDSFLDAARLLPLLFVIYLLVEYLEHKNNNFVHSLFAKSKKTGPLLGAVFGTVPQCGFSVIASELFSKKAISLGTMIAIFIATSDEAIPILIAHPDKFYSMLALIGIKFVSAVVFGFLIDFAVKTDIEVSQKEEEHHFHGNCESCDDGILKSAVIHSVKIFIFILLVNIILGFVTEFVAPLMQFITGHTFFQIVFSCLFGI